MTPNLEHLRGKADEALKKHHSHLSPDQHQAVRAQIDSVLPALVHLHGNNGHPAHFIVLKSTDTSFMDIQDPSRRCHLQLVLRDTLSRALDTMGDSGMMRPIVHDLSHETAAALEKVDEIGKGISIFGSARTHPGESDYDQARQLTRELSLMLQTPIWSGAGPGQMEAALAGAVDANGVIGGIKIQLPHSFEQDVSRFLTVGKYTLHTRFSGRKIGLIYASTRDQLSERTGEIITPGGLGTLDEGFEEWVLLQTKKSGAKWKSPFIIANYDGFYDGLLEWLRERVTAKHYMNADDFNLVCVCKSNREILEEFADFYNIPDEHRTFRKRVPKFHSGQHDLFPEHPYRGFYRSHNLSCLTEETPRPA